MKLLAGLILVLGASQLCTGQFDYLDDENDRVLDLTNTNIDELIQEYDVSTLRAKFEKNAIVLVSEISKESALKLCQLDVQVAIEDSEDTLVDCRESSWQKGIVKRSLDDEITGGEGSGDADLLFETNDEDLARASAGNTEASKERGQKPEESGEAAVDPHPVPAVGEAHISADEDPAPAGGELTAVAPAGGEPSTDKDLAKPSAGNTEANKEQGQTAQDITDPTAGSAPTSVDLQSAPAAPLAAADPSPVPAQNNSSQTGASAEEQESPSGQTATDEKAPENIENQTTHQEETNQTSPVEATKLPAHTDEKEGTNTNPETVPDGDKETPENPEEKPDGAAGASIPDTVDSQKENSGTGAEEGGENAEGAKHKPAPESTEGEQQSPSQDPNQKSEDAEQTATEQSSQSQDNAAVAEPEDVGANENKNQENEEAPEEVIEGEKQGTAGDSIPDTVDKGGNQEENSNTGAEKGPASEDQNGTLAVNESPGARGVPNLNADENETPGDADEKSGQSNTPEETQAGNEDENEGTDETVNQKKPEGEQVANEDEHQENSGSAPGEVREDDAPEAEHQDGKQENVEGDDENQETDGQSKTPEETQAETEDENKEGGEEVHQKASEGEQATNEDENQENGGSSPGEVQGKVVASEAENDKNVEGEKQDNGDATKQVTPEGLEANQNTKPENDEEANRGVPKEEGTMRGGVDPVSRTAPKEKDQTEVQRTAGEDTAPHRAVFAKEDQGKEDAPHQNNVEDKGQGAKVDQGKEDAPGQNNAEKKGESTNVEQKQNINQADKSDDDKRAAAGAPAPADATTSQGSSKGMTIFIVLIAVVLASGAAVFGYKRWKRKQRDAYPVVNESDNYGRELKEVRIVKNDSDSGDFSQEAVPFLDGTRDQHNNRHPSPRPAPRSFTLTPTPGKKLDGEAAAQPGNHNGKTDSTEQIRTDEEGSTKTDRQ